MEHSYQKSLRSGTSLGFLSIVTFLMVLVGVGYTVSTVVAKTPDTPKDSHDLANTGSSLAANSGDSSSSPRNVFSSFEEAIARQAIGFWNNLQQDSSRSDPSPAEAKADEGFLMPSSGALASVSLATALALPEVYEDIADSSFQYEILNLFSHQLIQGGKHFYPSNTVRISDFIRVVMDTYWLQQGMDSRTLVGKSQHQYLIDNSFPTEVLLRVNRAYEAGFLQKLALYDADHHLRLDAFISPEEALEMLRLMSLKSPHLVSIPQHPSFESQQTLRKDEMAKLVVDSFHLQFNQRSLPGFSDIYGSKYQDAIQALANLGIVGGVGGKFYPDAYLENKDFVIMLARMLLIQAGIRQHSLDHFYYLTHLKNAPTTATYSPYLEYCLEHEMCTTLLSQTPSGVTFQANKQLYFSDLVPLLSGLTSGSIILPAHGDGELITRGEAAYLLSQVLNRSTTAPTSEVSPLDSSSHSSSLGSSLRSKFQALMKVS